MLATAFPVYIDTAPIVVRLVTEQQIVPENVAGTLHMDNKLQFISTFCLVLKAVLSTNIGTAAEYHPQTNWQIEKLTREIVMQLQNFINFIQKDWNDRVHLMMHKPEIKQRMKVELSSFWLTFNSTS